MPVFVCAVDTEVAFQKNEYYLKFKGHEIKYVPRHAEKKRHTEGEQDDLLLKMDHGMGEEDAYLLITEFLSALSFAFDASFDTKGGFIPSSCNSSLAEITCSAACSRVVRVSKRHNEFAPIHPLQNEQEVKLARLYRIARSSNNEYSKTLFWWHCLCTIHNGLKEEKVADELTKFIEKVQQEELNVRINFTDLNDIIANPVLLKDKGDFKAIGAYIFTCVRHAIAHITRSENAPGKSISLDSLKELRHLHKVEGVLHGVVKGKMKLELRMDRDDDPNYIS